MDKKGRPPSLVCPRWQLFLLAFPQFFFSSFLSLVWERMGEGMGRLTISRWSSHGCFDLSQHSMTQDLEDDQYEIFRPDLCITTLKLGRSLEQHFFFIRDSGYWCMWSEMPLHNTTPEINWLCFH